MTLRFLTAGESHGPALTAILEGMPAGLELNEGMLDRELHRRQAGAGSGGRMKIEQDHARILGGVMNGTTTGAPLALLIENKDHSRWVGKEINALTTPRPGHADLTAALKYGYNDFRPALERASARETAARVAVGAICKSFLEQFDVHIGGYVAAIGEIQADLSHIPLEKRSSLAEENDVRCPSPAAVLAMQKRIREIMDQKDTLGGMIEVFALGVPAGLGSHVQWDRKLDARLGAAMLSIPAIKGIEIGQAFENTRLPGTLAHDPIRLDGQNLVRSSNRAGGVEGGISNGQPLLIRLAMKPIATTLTPQQTVDLSTGLQTETVYERSDICPVPRAVPVAEAMLAYVLADVLIEKLGGDSLEEMKPRFATLRQPNLKDLSMQADSTIFWPTGEDK